MPVRERPKTEGLDIKQDFDFQQRSWKRQRFAWGAMAVILLAALLGLFGSGVFSNATAGNRNGTLWMEYNRFGRLMAETTTIRVHVGPGVAEGGRVRLWVDSKFLESVDINHVTPEPEFVEAGPDRYMFSFRVPDQSPAEIVFDLEPHKFGLLRGEAGIDGGPALRFNEIVYP